MKLVRCSAAVIYLAVCPLALGQKDSSIVAKAWTLNPAAAKSFCDGGTVLGHQGDSLGINFNLQGAVPRKYPHMTSISVFWLRGKPKALTVFFKPGTVASVALTEIGFPKATIGLTAYSSLPNQPLSPRQILRLRATTQGVQEVAGIKIGPYTTGKFFSQKGRESYLDVRS